MISASEDVWLDKNQLHFQQNELIGSKHFIALIFLLNNMKLIVNILKTLIIHGPMKK